MPSAADGIGDVLLTQTATVVYRVRYSRANMIELLKDLYTSGELAAMTNQDLGILLTRAASDDANGHGAFTGLYRILTEDAGEPEEQISADDWELTEVYGAEK